MQTTREKFSGRRPKNTDPAYAHLQESLSTWETSEWMHEDGPRREKELLISRDALKLHAALFTFTITITQ